MHTLIAKLWKDEAGFIVSAELILVGTICVLSMVVGLAEVANGINNELNDVAGAFQSVNQGFRYSGIRTPRNAGPTYSAYAASYSDKTPDDALAIVRR